MQHLVTHRLHSELRKRQHLVTSLLHATLSYMLYMMTHTVHNKLLMALSQQVTRTEFTWQQLNIEQAQLGSVHLLF